MVPGLRQALRGSISQTVREFLNVDLEPIGKHDWVCNQFEINIGYLIVPTVLALRTEEISKGLKAGTDITASIPKVFHSLLGKAGYIDEKKQVTNYGARVFSRGPGPFGIIHAYHAYMEHLGEWLGGKNFNAWVARGENVAASQDANRKTFALGNDSLDRFCKDHKFSFNVFIEHAVGQGEATRQRFERSGEDNIKFFGADLEDTAIDAAINAQKEGHLPKNMEFIRNADIGNPQIIIDAIKAKGYSTKNAVMMVGNGFHEVREQSNERMIEVFKGYCDAGIILIFTEESGLTDDDLLETAFNTYHAGFRYTHELSGQGLRPVIDSESINRFSWEKCAMQGGYQMLKEYTTRTRKIFPYPKPNGYNPAISVNYFCLPKDI